MFSGIWLRRPQSESFLENLVLCFSWGIWIYRTRSLKKKYMKYDIEIIARCFMSGSTLRFAKIVKCDLMKDETLVKCKIWKPVRWTPEKRRIKWTVSSQRRPPRLMQRMLCMPIQSWVWYKTPSIPSISPQTPNVEVPHQADLWQWTSFVSQYHLPSHPRNQRSV